MEHQETVSRGISALPNEILLSIFSLLATPELLPLAPTCQQFHALILRVVHHRLQIAASLDGHSLYIECYHPSARVTASNFFCTSLGTDGLQELLTDINNDPSYVGQIKRCGSLYSRFRPQRNEPTIKIPTPHPAGDIPGSRTYQSPSELFPGSSDEDVVSETVTVDAHDLFSQLTTVAFLGKRESQRGLLHSIHDVCEGTIRVWREWLSRRCQTKKWTDGDSVPVHHETPSSPTSANQEAGGDGDTIFADPTKDPSVLWINTRRENVGIKFRVKERKWRRANPILFTNDIEVAASYQVEFEEVYVRTAHLLLRLEEAQRQMNNHTGKAIVFGSYTGLQEFDTNGRILRR